VAYRLVTLVVLVSLALVQPALAQEQELVLKKIAVLPFTVSSKEPLPHLGDKVRQDMEDRLKSDGFTLIPRAEIHQAAAHPPEPLTDAWAKEVGQKLKADMVIWGGVIKVGDVVSLETHLVDITGRMPPVTQKAQGTGLPALSAISRQVAQELSLKILGKERVTRMNVKGNRRIEKDAILGVMQTREGEILAPPRLREDLKTIYKMGYFTDVKIDLSDTPEGRILTVIVTEKPAIKDIIPQGNAKIKKDKILESLDIKPYAVASETAIRDGINKVLVMYRDKGYYEANITYDLQPVTDTEVNLVLHINEGGKLAIKDIEFEGNRAFKSKELRNVMETKERGLFFIAWMTGAGKLNKDILERDLEKVSAFYYNHGYIKAKVGEPRVSIKGGWIYVTIPVEEGPQYHVGKLDMQGDLIEEKDALLKKLDIATGKVYSREVLQKDLTTLADIYADQGYANADIAPLLKERDDTLTVDINFDIHQGKKVYFERIDIAGNIKTRDKVIRRELRVYEQDLFNATNLKESVKNLRRLEYFEDVNFNTSPGSAPDRLNLKITVKERPTGSFGIGAGYSTQDRVVGMVEISQTNLFGRGQTLKVQGVIGAISNRLRASFFEPYLFDRPLGLGIDAFNWMRQYTEYTRKSRGGVLRLTHPLRWKYSRVYWSYRFENVNLENLEANPSPTIVEASRIHNTSATSFTLRRDSRDAVFTPTQGSDNSISCEMAGLGGDTAFMRYIAESGWYFPLFWGTVGVLHGRGGYMNKLQWGKMPAYEMFYLGGIDTIRGFKYADISPRDPNTGDRIGGESFAQMNVEFRFPLLPKLGMTGTIFFDAGNVYGSDSIGPALRTTLGGGIRWFSPMGPLRVEWGYNLSKKPWEKQSAWEFTVGSQF
jgi:outer membrane protein insertion porin family